MLIPLMAMALAVALLAPFAPPARADEGHSHDAPAAAPAGPALPRFAASSELFEMVGVANGKQLTIYLDRFDDNAPVSKARVDLEIGGAKIPLQEHADGELEGTLADILKPGITPVTATVVAGGDSDLLAGEFDVHEEDAHAAPRSGGWKRYGGIAAGLLALAAIAMLGLRRRAAQRRAGGTA